MPDFGDTIRITSDEHREIFARLQPHLPPYLTKVEPSRYGYGLCFEFKPFTGREEEPSAPDASYDDPKLRYSAESDDPAEYRLRVAAREILSDLYSRARAEWKVAAYVADLRQVVKDAPARWEAYEQAANALDSAYGYLRTPQAGAEWPSAISRLVDAQERALAAARAFDDRAAEIAAVQYKHLYADLGDAAALAAAGYPEAKDWHIGDGFGGYYSQSLLEKVRHLTDEQDAHLAKVGRLAGSGTALA
ncbi:hypothetical protein [Streptomyces sp. NPDC048106]|uniref:hypothetical protein n=1 Tax=Streptomyces sp. NPDC048106 TaxID=3155750 RepID=UPI0034548C44